jgi:NAD(P)-dependent dehydrogenase (short-subunit alcohol dehydrogenase family)
MTIFLTGGTGGIGSVIKTTLRNAGVDVIAPNSSELNLGTEFDVSTTEVDGFIHCAGINTLAKHDKLRAGDLLHLFAINTFSFVELCGQLKFRNNANIIAIGSLYATGTREERIQYTMSKHALLGAVKTLALEKASDRVKVNMVSPGFVDTPLTRKNNSEERIQQLNENIPLGLVDPCEIANLCLYLIKQNNSITGHNFVVDGGYSIKGL